MFKSMKAPKNGAGSSAESLAPDQITSDDRNSGTTTPPIMDTPKALHSPVLSSPLDQPTVSDFRTPGSLADDETPTNVVIIPNSNTATDLSSSTTTSGGGRTFAVRATAPRSQSAGSSKSVASTMSSTEICRICHCESTTEMPLISPCYCSGTLKYVHQKCLQQWIKSSQTRSCEVCRFSFIMQTKLKPFRKWEKLDISSVERRKILCSVAFHVIAITCVIWSLYVLIDRTAEEIRENSLEWPFWTKLVVVAIGFTGGLVFMYVQCKMYVQLFRRWKAYNKVIYVQNGPSGPSPITKETFCVGIELK